MAQREMFGCVAVVFAASLLVSGGMARANTEALAPSQEVKQRFIKVYRVDEAIVLAVRDAIYEASMQDGPYKPYYACLNKGLTPERFNDLALRIVGESFPDKNGLEQVITFFETKTGGKLRDSVMNDLAQRPVRRTKGLPSFQPGDYPLTNAEVAEVNEFEKAPGYSDFQKFRDAIGAVGSHPGMKAPLAGIKSGCATHIK